jgi:hypothetical protein
MIAVCVEMEVYTACLRASKIHESCDNDGNHDPKNLVPVEERKAEKVRCARIVKWGPEKCNKGDDEQEQEPAPVPSV